MALNFVRSILLGFSVLAMGGLPLGIQRVNAQSTFDWKQLGERTYSTNCGGCHQANGQGIPGAFPPLAEHTAEVYTASGGRSYLINVLLYGVQGEITASGKTFNGAMPAFGQLKDDEVAAVLNHILTSWNNQSKLPGNFAPVLPGEVATARNTRLTAAQTLEQRKKLNLGAKPAQPTATQPPSNTRWFTKAQSTRGKTVYARECLDCHGQNLDDGEFGGAPLKGNSFEAKWTKGTAAPLFAYMSTNMPPASPGSLNPSVYADILAYILEANGYEAGDRELPSDANALQQVRLAR